MSAAAPAIPAVYGAIGAVLADLAKEGIAKDRKNTAQGYAFRGIDDIYNVLAGLLADHRLCILPRVLSRIVTERETKTGGVLFYVVVDVEYDLISAVDGSKHTVRVCGEAMDSGDKATNKAMSAAYKYACLQTFCIPTEGDNDADATTHEVAGKKAAPAAGKAAERATAAKAAAAAKPAVNGSADAKDWKNVAIHFGKNQGRKLGELPEDTLAWYINKWTPKAEYANDPANKLLRDALDNAYAELKTRQEQAAEGRDIPADAESF